MTLSYLIHEAMDFAALAHAGQSRKRGDIPYVSHAAAVGLMLQKAGMEEVVVAAGLLHDVIEDTGFGYDALEMRFGRVVAGLVQSVSEQDKSLPWTERKTAYIERLRTASRGALAIAAADKIHNMRSILLYGEGGGDPWAISKGDRSQQIWYYTTVFEIVDEKFGTGPREGFAELRDGFAATLGRFKALGEPV
jgi:(p)ppGpp synthase/HD superfamily hydrolase